LAGKGNIKAIQFKTYFHPLLLLTRAHTHTLTHTHTHIHATGGKRSCPLRRPAGRTLASGHGARMLCAVHAGDRHARGSTHI
jgi:hypothetical protein